MTKLCVKDCVTKISVTKLSVTQLCVKITSDKAVRERLCVCDKVMCKIVCDKDCV